MSDTSSTQEPRVECPHCNEKGQLTKTASGRLILTPVGGAGGSALGVLLGRVTGIAGKMTMPATVPFGAGGLVMGGMAGYLAGDHLDYIVCDACGEKINIYR